MPCWRRSAPGALVWNLATVVALVLVVSACTGRSAGTTNPDSGTPDAAVDASQPVDGAMGPDGATPVDAGPSTCQCSAGEVYRWHECVPTLELGCGPACDPVVTDCGEYHRD